MVKHRTTPAAMKMLMEGQLALAEIEHAGLRIDKAYLDFALGDTARQIKEMEFRLREDKVYRQWRRAYGTRAKLSSRDQLADLVFNHLGYEAKGMTRGGKRVKADKEALESVDLEFVRDYVKYEELKKARSTYLKGIASEAVETSDGWFVHPNYNLNTVVTFRSSSNSPNFQNQPNRNPFIAETVRKVYIPRRGRHVVESDLAQIEVRVPAAITGDDALRKYVLDKSTDMHRDQAREVFCCQSAPPEYWKDKKAGKPVRQTTKTNFVFASFYGSAFYNAAKKLWEDIDIFGLKGPGGVPMKEHLAGHGITELDVVLVKDQRSGRMVLDHDPRPGSFGHHVRKCQENLWRTFSGYGAWRQARVDAYRREGGLTMVTGCSVAGMLLGQNEIPNYHIQGPAFHCLLIALPRVIRRLRKYKMKALVTGEIHDSMQGDVPTRELNDYLDVCHEAMTDYVMRTFDWLGDIPIEIEQEVSPRGASWFDKQEWVRGESGWALPAKS